MPDRLLRIHPEAAAEAEAAIDWYLERSTSAAQAFADEVRRALLLVAQTPERWSIFDADARRYLLRDFPYALIYRLTGDTLQVLAVAHLRRRPGYWRSRSF